MARNKSFFSKLTDYVLDKDGEEESAEDIDRRVEAEVAAIKKKKQKMLDGAEVIKDDWNTDDDVVFIMDLAPIYELIGGRKGTLATRLPDVCAMMFDRLVPAVEGRGRLRGDLFMMTFSHPSREAGFRKAAEVINEIGLQTIGERFKNIEVPGLLVAADPVDLTGEDGGFDPKKAKAQIESGGSGCILGEPGPDEPVWLKLSVEKATQAVDLVESASPAKAASNPNEPRPRRRGDPDWADERAERRLRISSDPMQMERRSGRDRRSNR